jgi:hypothetical protein
VLAAGCSTTAERDIPSTIELRTYFRELKTTQLLVNGKALTFLVDSAAGRTLISREVAGAIGCTPSGRDVAYRMTGEAVIFATCDALAASASGFALFLRPVAVFDVNALLPRELPKVDGVLALDAFRGHVVSIDWSHDRLVVHAPQDEDAALAANGVPTRIATGENGAGLSVLVPVRSASRPLWFLLDSADIRGTLVAQYVDDHDLLSRAADGTVSIAIGEGPGAQLVPVVDEINLDGVLGTAYLNLRTITLDLRRTP